MQNIKSDKENLNITFNWFDSEIASRIIKALSSYWEINFNVMMNEINDYESIKEDPVLKGELFYTCQIPIKKFSNGGEETDASSFADFSNGGLSEAECCAVKNEAGTTKPLTKSFDCVV